jgi:hypothetical protein
MNEHPIRIHVRDDLRRSRLTVFFRPLLVIPHYIWLELWAVLVILSIPFLWLVALFMGRLPQSFHRFYAAFTRYSAHVYSYLFLVGNPFPGFVGARGSYPLDLETPPVAEQQNRLGIFFRLLLALPALMLSGILGYLLYVVGFAGWFVGLIRGRMAPGLRDLGAYAVRYQAQVYGYVFLVTGTYPNSSPNIGTLFEEPAGAAPAIAVAPEQTALAPPPTPPAPPAAPEPPTPPESEPPSTQI